MRRGRWAEAAAFEALAELEPTWTTQRARVFVFDDETRMSCTPDGFWQRPDRDGIGVVQVKAINRDSFRRRWLDDSGAPIEDGEASPPAAYHLQTLQEMVLNGCEWRVIVALVIGEYGWSCRRFELARDPVIEALMAHQVRAFLARYLDPGIMPPFEPARDEALVRALYPKDNGTTIDLTNDNRAAVLVEELIETKAALKRLETKDREIKTELQGKLGEATFGTIAGGRCLSWKVVNRKGFTVAPSSSRQLRVLDPVAD
jgi:hypothetical protein